MRLSAFYIALCILVFACKQSVKETADMKSASRDSVEKPNFIPVTNLLLGEIYNIRQKGVNPLMYVSSNNRKDSSWVKAEFLEDIFKDFLTPKIDNTNLAGYFSESKFFDQTLNALTFTYDPKTQLPDSMQLQHWDVYVDPESEKVKQVYMMKKLPGKKTQQLTWMTGKECNIKLISEDSTGRPVVEKETLIKWDF